MFRVQYLPVSKQMSSRTESMKREREQMYWSRLNQAVSAFCLENALDSSDNDKMICSLVGEELEWCGSHAYLFMASRYMQVTNRITELERKRSLTESALNKELANSAHLRKSLKIQQVASEDAEWQFQEQLAQTKHLVDIEKGNNLELRVKIDELERKLRETEKYNFSNADIEYANPLKMESDTEKDHMKLNMSGKHRGSYSSGEIDENRDLNVPIKYKEYFGNEDLEF